jgi:hypothetical protein
MDQTTTQPLPPPSPISTISASVVLWFDSFQLSPEDLEKLGSDSWYKTILEQRMFVRQQIS